MVRKPTTESEAFCALKAGHEKGLNFFFDRYYSPLIFYATKITGHQEAAKEIVSEAFVKLWQTKEGLSEWQKAKPLLYRIVYNASIDFLRQQKVHKHVVNGYAHTLEHSESAVLETLIQTETYHRLYLLLEFLPHRCRQIFRMFYFQKKSIKEIAAELGVSVNTVKTQKLRAIQTLRENSGLLVFMLGIYPLIFR